MSIKRDFGVCVSTVLLVVASTVSVPASADNAGAFLGGMITSRVLSNMTRRTRAEERQAANSSRQVATVAAPAPAPAPAPASSTRTVEQRLSELDKLAAGGYITPEEYKAKKQAILNSI